MTAHWSVRRRRQLYMRVYCHVRLSIELAMRISRSYRWVVFPRPRDYPSNDESDSDDGDDLILRQSSARTSAPRRAPANGEKIFEVKTEDKGPEDAETCCTREITLRRRTSSGRDGRNWRCRTVSVNGRTSRLARYRLFPLRACAARDRHSVSTTSCRQERDLLVPKLCITSVECNPRRK